ncbi:hypothetical protein SEPCBS119000_004991 [Sporothrix epigloea]|uniref:Uncharacterized protein n=1 Tax=Sporothrix epigloea TaxID=1892477 RepID=A0ABP0DZ31_9PEZI
MSATMMMLPMFNSGPDSPDRLPRMPAFAHSPFRPMRPSPLSSPIQSGPQVSPLQPDTQSSPIQQTSSAASMLGASPMSLPDLNAHTLHEPRPFPNPSGVPNKGPAFRFASRPSKPIPRGQLSRDAAQQTRRTLFLRNVRQRADEHNWARRDLEQELQKLEWWSLERELRQARESDVMSILTDQDIEDAETWMLSPSSSQPSSLPAMPCEQNDIFVANTDTNYARWHHNGGMCYDLTPNEEYGNAEDERMVELLMREEEAEMEALTASMSTDTDDSPTDDNFIPQPERPSSTTYSDDTDYDVILNEIFSGAEEDTVMDSI